MKLAMLLIIGSVVLKSHDEAEQIITLVPSGAATGFLTWFTSEGDQSLCIISFSF